MSAGQTEQLAPATSDMDVYGMDARGCVEHARCLDAAAVARARAALEEHWPSKAPEGLRRVKRLTELHPEFAELATRLPRALDIFRYMNQPFRLIESYAINRGPASVQHLHNGFSEPVVTALGASHRTMWRHHTYHDGKLYCMMAKILVYLTDIAAVEDGPFCYVEGSHKANFPLPVSEAALAEPGRFESLSGARTIYARAGDAIVLNEALMHGTLPKTSPGSRLVMAFSYAPSFVTDYHELPPAAAVDMQRSGFYA